MEKAIEVLQKAQWQVYQEYQRIIYSIHYGQIIGKDPVELAEIRKNATKVWQLSYDLAKQIKELSDERVDA
jgi:hypothetical protein